MRCSICDRTEDLPSGSSLDNSTTSRVFIDKKTEDPICFECRQAHFNETVYYSDQALGEGSSIEEMLIELERRVPGLFSGPVCPSKQFVCDCSFESGCRLLTDQAQMLA